MIAQRSEPVRYRIAIKSTRLFRASVVAISASSFFFFPIAVNALFADVATGVVTGGAAKLLLDELTEDAEQLMQDAAAKGDDLRIKIAADLLRIIASIKGSIDDTVNSVEVKVDNQQRVILSGIQEILVSARIGVEINRDEVQKSVEAIQQDISNKLPFGYAPIVTRAYPYFVIAGSRQTVVVKIRGINLGKQYQKLTVENETYSSIGSSPDSGVSPLEAVFQIPIEKFVAGPNEIKLLNATLEVDTPASGLWNWIWGKKKAHRISIPITVAPESAGRLTVTAKLRNLNRGNDTVRKGTYWRGKSTGCTPYSYRPEAGWIIDVSSWRITGTQGEYGYVLHSRPGEVTPELFSLQVCVKVKHNKGTETAFVEWTEYQMVESFENEVLFDDVVAWTGRSSIELPENATSISSTFTNFLGHVEDAAATHVFSYAKIEYDLGQKKMFVSGKPDALTLQ